MLKESITRLRRQLYKKDKELRTQIIPIPDTKTVLYLLL